MPTQGGRGIGGWVAAFALVFTVLIALGIGYEQLARQRDRSRWPQVGRSVDIGGRTLNISCSGAGSPTVVLESDALAPGYSWVFVQGEIAKLTRACWYDRAGYGWSEDGPAPHTSKSSASDLHALLGGAGIPPPYLLVGNRFGSLNVRVYNGMFPGEVAGMVLLDPIEEAGERMGMAGRVPFHLGYPPDLVLRTVGRIGLMRLLHHDHQRGVIPKGLTSGERATLLGLQGEPKMRAAFLAEQGFSTSLEEVRSAGGFGDRPLIVLRSEDSSEFSSPAEARAAEQAPLSTRERQVVVKNTEHNIQYEAPEAVVVAVRDVLAELRGKP